jgi:acetyl-CoA carboxylase biotin carboxylase subunit
MGEAAVKAAKAVSYVNAGTVEFMVDSHGRFHFLEMNTRIQVEHPVTEMVTGIDLVREQIRIAYGHKLGRAERDIEQRGHAIECRITAEDHTNRFLASGGTVTGLRLPGGPGVRVDTHLYPGYTIPPFYDALLAKLVVWAPTRPEAISRAARALGEFQIEGLKTTIPFHQQVLTNAYFRRGEIATNFLRRRMGLS